MSDVFQLQRFLDAQASVYRGVVAELREGRKRSHWMWFIFPQIAGLGLSPTSAFFAISSLDEARAYARHPVLGARLLQCAELMLAAAPRSAVEILGPIDALKFHSCMSLFSVARPDDPMFKACLETFFAGEPDPATLARL